MSPVLDRIFLTGLILLIVGTPFAIGSAPPRAYAIMEAAIFGLVIVWMLKIIGMRYQGLGLRQETPENLKPNTQHLTPGRQALPLLLFIGLVLCQLMPLPPTLLRLISPGTFEFYSQIFFGWPEQAPYGDLQIAGARDKVSGVSEAAPNPSPNTQNTQNLIPSSQHLLPQTWLPLSVAPYLTKIDLLKLLAYAALFYLVLRYPYGESWERAQTETTPLGKRPPDERLLRGIIWAVLGSGFMVGFIGFVQRFSWNGKILWFYEPYSIKPAGAGAITRASGPFVNPDHFANYVALVLPIALACVLFRTALAHRERQPMLRILAGAAVFVMFTGVLLSLSRGALAAVCMSIAVLLALMPWGEAETRSAKHMIFRGAAIVRLSAIVFCALLIVGLYFAGPTGREQVDARVAGGLVDEISLGGRAQIWRDSPKLIADYPLFGVGLGAWPEVFMRYRSDPWGLNFFREAHNDYIQLLSEAGFVGLMLIVWFVYLCGRQLLPGLKRVTSRYRPPIAGIIAACAGMALHEWFDFNLRIPANAFLFVVLVALALRAVGSDALRTKRKEESGKGKEQGAGSREPERARSQPELVPATPFGLSGTGAARFSIASFLQSLKPKTQYPTSETWQLNNLRLALSPLRVCSASTQYPTPYPSGSLLRALCSLLSLRVHLKPDTFNLSPARLRYANGLAFAAAAGPSSILQPRGSLLHEYKPEFAARSSLLHASGASRVAPFATIALCIFLIVQALNQNPIPYPFNLGEAESLVEAKENVLIFPTNALYHDTILNFLGDPPPLVWQLRQLSAALWLEPANPYFRDRYAAALVQAGRADEALREITVSVYNAPDFNVHGYLAKDGLAKLSPAQQRAIEAGFHRAMARHSPSAVAGLGEFYAGVGRFAEQAALYEQAALAEKDAGRKVDLALRAGAAYAKAQNFAKAERLMSEAIVSNRADPRPYEYLIREIYGARKDLLGAKQILSEGLRNGAPALALNLALAEAAHKAENADEVDNALAAAKSVVAEAAKELYPFEMYLQLADGAGRVGARDQELAAMLAALELQPTDSDVLSRIANVYSGQKNYDRTVMYLEKLAQVEYNSGYVFFRLAQAEEARYRYAAAGRAYGRAIELDRDNKDYKAAYAAFKKQVEDNSIAKGKEVSGKGGEPDAAAAKGKAQSGKREERRGRR